MVVVRFTEDLLGPKHITTLETRIYQAELLFADGCLQEAEIVCQEVLAELRLSHDKLHPVTLRAYDCEVTIYTAKGRLTEARNTAKALVSWNQLKLGKRHIQTLQAQRTLAVVHAARGEFAEAKLIRNVISDAKSILGPNHLFTLESRADMIRIQCQSGDFPSAWESAFETLWSIQAAFGLGVIPFESVPQTPGDHPFTNLHADIVHLVLEEGCWPVENQPYRQCILEVFQCFGICEVERLTGTPELGIERLQLVFANRKRGLEYLNVETMWCMNHLAKAYHRMGDLEKAYKIFDEVLESGIPILGPDHYLTLVTQFLRNVVLYHMEDEISLQEQREIFAHVSGLLGHAHPDTLSLQSELSVILHDMGYLEEAEKEQMKALYSRLSGSKPVSSTSEDLFLTLDKISKGEEVPKIAESEVLSGIETLVYIERDLGYHDKAITTQEAFLALGRAWGCAAERMMDAVHDLGYLFQARADACKLPDKREDGYRHALKAYDEVLDWLEELEAPNNQLLLDTQANKAYIFFKSGDLDTARKLQIEIEKTIRTDEELNSTLMHVQSIYNLALTENAMNNVSAALKQLGRSFEMTRDNLGLDHPMHEKLFAVLQAWKRESRLST